MFRLFSVRSWIQIVLIGSLAACRPAPSPTLAPPLPTPSVAFPAATVSVDLPSISSTPTNLDPTPTPSATGLPTLSPLGQISLPGQRLTALAVDRGYAYWVTLAEPRNIVRAPLISADSPQPELVIQSRYTTGSVSAMPIQVRGDWLVFLDQAFNANNPLWRLRAYNLMTHQEKVIDYAGGDLLARIYSFSLDGSLVAWITQTHDFKLACAEKSTLSLVNLVDGNSKQLMQNCAVNDRQWNTVQVSNSRVIASATEIKNSGSQNAVFFWNSPQADPQTLSQAYPADQPSSPVLGKDWYAWQSSPGETRILRMNGEETRLLTSPLDGDLLAGPQFSGSSLIWMPTLDLLLYQPETSAWQVVATPGAGEQITQVAASSGWIAWSRERTNGNQKSIKIEWISLD
jgi:hypothetical protein